MPRDQRSMNRVISIPRSGQPGSELLRPSSSAHKVQKLSWRQRQQARIAVKAAAVWKVLKPYPSTLVWPLVVLAALLIAGVWGVTRVAQATADSTKDRVEALAMDAVTWYRQCITESYAPVISLSVIIHHDPYYTQVSRLFESATPDLMAMGSSGAIRSLQLAPNGVVRFAYPTEGNEMVLSQDLFEVDPAGALATVTNARLTLIGPLNFTHGGFGVRARMPVFVPHVGVNTTFGAPDDINPICGQPCEYNATSQTRFWGFSSAMIELQTLHTAPDSRLKAILDGGYNYALLAPTWNVSTAKANTNSMSLVASSPDLPTNPVEVEVVLPETKWVLRVAPREGWMPQWYAPMLAGVVVLAVAISALIFAVLLSRRQHQALLEALLPREMIDHLKTSNAEGHLGPRIMESATTTADVLLNLLGELLEGITPDLRDIVLIRQQILQNMDIYQPLNLSSQLRDANLDDDVTKALMHQLGGKFSFSISAPNSDCEDGMLDDPEGGEVRGALARSVTMGQHDYATLSGALAMILAPQAGWYDNGPDLSDAASDAALPTHENETAVSPRPSNNSIFGRAASAVVRQNSWRCGSPDRSPAAAAGAANGGGGGAIAFASVVAAAQAQAAATAAATAAVTRPGTAMTAMAVGEGLPAVGFSPGRTQVPPPAPDADRLAAANASVTSIRCARGTEDGLVPGSATPCGGAALITAFSGGALRRPPRKGDSHTSLINFGRVRRKSALLTVSIADGAESNSGGAHGKTLSSGSHPDPVFTVHGGPHGPEGHQPSILGGVRLWAATVSRRSITGAGSVLGQTLSKNPPTPSLPVIEEVERVLAEADSWQFDTWRLRDVTNGHPLSALGFYLIQRAGLIGQLKLKPHVLARLLRHIEAGYNDNPYHNATHAADVLQTLHVIMYAAQMQVHYVDHLGLLAAYFAAIVHDYGHPGLTNDFLVATSDPLAVRYNDRSPLENHHAAAAFSSMRRSGLDVLAPLSTEQKSAFRKQVIEMVLATDMKQHFSLLSHFTTVHRLANYTNKPQGSTTPLSSNLELQKVSIHPPNLSETAPKPLDDTERLLSLQVAIKAADLGHLGEALEVHKRWLNNLEEEFFRQGDKERQLGVPMSPLFDRSKQGVSKSQIGFYDFVAFPLVHALSSAFPGTQPLMSCFMANYNHYRSLEPVPESRKAPPPPPPQAQNNSNWSDRQAYDI